MNEHSSGNRRILVIDDNAAIHEDYCKVLCAPSFEDASLDSLSAELFDDPADASTSVHYELDSAYQGRDALSLVEDALKRGVRYAMAFVDMRMPPGWDGLETIEHLWKVDPELNVVICTAYSDYSWQDVVDRLGTNDRWLILKKPFDTVEICQFAAALAEKRRLADELRLEMEALEAKVAQRTSELENREHRLRAILDTAPDGILVLDQDGVIQSFNHAAEDLFGVSPTFAIGKSVATLICPEEGEECDPVSQLLLKDEQLQTHSLQIRAVRTGGTVFPSHWTIGKCQGAETKNFTVIVRDETERELMQRELSQSQKMESIGQLAAGIAHEINTPMQFVSDNTQFLKQSLEDLYEIIEFYRRNMDPAGQGAGWAERYAASLELVERCQYDLLREEVPSAIQESVEGIERVINIVRAMKEFAHPGGSSKVTTDLNQAIRSTVTISRNRWKYAAELEMELDPSLPCVEVLPAEINQVFLNLIVNAGDAIAEKQRDSDEQGLITVRTKQEGEQVVIEIADTGAGIPESIQHRVFDPFFTTKDVGKGTGQGLSICHDIVINKHGGRIEFESIAGVGTTFLIQLPIEARHTESNSKNAHVSLLA